jgi:tetratricopeptide (TPR) repeat protein
MSGEDSDRPAVSTRSPRTASQRALEALVRRWERKAARQPAAAEAQKAVERLTEAANLVCYELGRGGDLVLGARRLALVLAEGAAGAESQAASYPRATLATELTESGEVLEADRLLAQNVAHAEARGAAAAELAGALYALAEHRVLRDVDGDPEPIVRRLSELVERDASVREDFEVLVAGLAIARSAEADASSRVEAELSLVDAVRGQVGTKHPDYAFALMNLGELHLELDQHDDAERALSRARELLDDHPGKGFVVQALVDLDEARGRPEQALALLVELEEMWKHQDEERREELREQKQRLEDAIAASRAPQWMRHPKLGVGQVVSREGDTIRLRMEDGNERTFLADRLEALPADAVPVAPSPR